MRYVFGECTLDTEQYILYRPDGPLPLQPKVFQVLLYLLTHRERVIAKQELSKELWPDQFISDATLEGVIKAVRRAVGDDGRTQWCIQTRRGQGYRFIAALMPSPASPQSTTMAAAVGAEAQHNALPPVVSAHAPDLHDVTRRQLTVLCCHLTSSQAMSTQMEPEDFREIVLAFQKACTEVIERFDGFVAPPYLGHGLLGYFGYPQAHEDDALRAVRAGLGLLEAIARLNGQRQGNSAIHLGIGVGLHTGPMVVSQVGGEGRHEPFAFGLTADIADAIQGLAAPHTLVISAATYQLVRGFFTCQTLGKQMMQGVVEPVEVYRVLRESGVQSRFELATARGLTPLIGRDAEMRLLQERWEQVKEGFGQVVLVSGELGIGKSRLGQELKAHVVRDGGRSLTLRGSPYHVNSAFAPVIEHLQQFLQWSRHDSPQEKLGKLEQALRDDGLPMADMLPLFAALLSLPTSHQYPPLTLSPERQKQKTLEALVAWLQESARRQPLLALCEDLHWADSSTLELLHLLVQQAPQTRVLCLMTFRPPFQPPWPLRSALTQITLNRLSPSQVQQMAQQVVGGKVLRQNVVQFIVDKTDGIPLFVEEFLAMLLETRLLHQVRGSYAFTANVPSLTIPATLHDALMARLDRQGAAREVACLGATIGRAFSYELLRAISPLDEATLHRGLSQLVENELLYQQGFPPQARYLFKHVLIRDIAYQSLLHRTRRQYHQRIAATLIERFPETVDTQPELVAHHYTEAGHNSEAIAYWLRAGRRAVEQSAYAEAIGHLRKGLALLKTVPENAVHAQQELALQTTLGLALSATQGYGAADVEDAYLRARQLCQQLGDTPELLPVLEGLRVFYNLRAAFQTAQELAEQLLVLARRAQDAAFLVHANMALGVVCLYRGELHAAQAAFEQGAMYATPQPRNSLPPLQGRDADVVCLSFTALNLWLLGYPDQALARSRLALERARVLSHAHTLAAVLGLAADLRLSLRHAGEALALIEEGLALSTEQAFAFWAAMQTMQRGAVLARLGRIDEGIAQLRHGLAVWQKTGAKVAGTRWHALLAEAYGVGGRVEEGLTVLSKALALGASTGEHFWQAELYRLQGDLLGQQAVIDGLQLEVCFRQALDVAQRQGAKTLELRAATSLARLWQQRGEREAAYALLAPIYGWFTEGFDTADLQDAAALLGALR